MLNRADALTFLRSVGDLIEANREDEARTQFNGRYAEFYDELGAGERLADLATVFFELDEFLNDEVARDLGAVSKDLVLSSLQYIIEDRP